MQKIGILKFRNSNSVPLLRTLLGLGYQASLVESASLIANQDKLIIPGVGHIGALVRELDLNGYREPLHDFIYSEKYILGICLGMQLLASGSEEDPLAQTLNVFATRVNQMVSDSTLGVRVPHVGWNSVNYIPENQLFNDIPQDCDFYFTHSFAVKGVNEQTISTSFHGEVFTSALNATNVFGVQFHPEKSQKYGEKLLANFCEMGS